MKNYSDFRFTYSEYTDKKYENKEEWLEYLSPKAIEAYDEFTNQDYQEDY